MTELQKRSTATLENLASEINAEHRAFVGSLKKTAEHGIRAGELLTEAKSKCKHGEWLGWLEKNFEGSARSAQVYTQLFERRGELRAKTQSSAHLSISGALKELSGPKEEEKAQEKEELTDEQVAELVRAFMEMEGPTELSDIEQAALEGRLAKVGERERDLLSGIHFEHMMMYGCQVAQDGFILDERDDGQGVVEWRSPDKKKLYRFAMPEPGKSKLPESERPRIKRGTKVYGVLTFQVWRLLSNWFTEVLIAEVDDVKKAKNRIEHNADWRQAEPAGEFIRDRLLREGFRDDDKLDMEEWALRHHVPDQSKFEQQVLAVEKVWVALRARSLEEGLMGAEN
jgi:hypothetical protein